MEELVTQKWLRVDLHAMCSTPPNATRLDPTLLLDQEAPSLVHVHDSTLDPVPRVVVARARQPTTPFVS